MTSTLQTVDHDFLRRFSDRWHAAWNSHDPEQVVALCTPDVVLEQSSSPTLHGHAGVRAAVAQLVRASEDYRFEEAGALCLSADGRTAVVPWRLTGTMTGPLVPPGFAPTGRAITLEGDDHWQFDDGLMARTRALFDTSALAVQLGAAPAPGSAGEKAAVLLQRLTAAWMRRRTG
jgi:ketosteroid isomerase-like protein